MSGDSPATARSVSLTPAGRAYLLTHHIAAMPMPKLPPDTRYTARSWWPTPAGRALLATTP